MYKLDPKTVESIRRHCNSEYLDAHQVIRILESKVAPGAATARTRLVHLLKTHQFKFKRLHDDSVGSDDRNLHYTVTISGRNQAYHLQVDSRGVIWRITDSSEKSLSGKEPWEGPGT